MEQDYRPSKDLRDALVIISSTTTALGTNLTLTDSALTEGDDYWNNMAVVILSGNSIGQIRRISDFDAASDTITIDTAFASVIASGTKYNIVAQHVPASGAGDATAANQVLILADTATIKADSQTIEDSTLKVAPTAGSLSSFIATGGVALGTALPNSKSLYDIILDRIGTPSATLATTILDGIDGRANNPTLNALLGVTDASGRSINGNVGDFQSQTNLQTLLAVLGIPDTAAKPLYTCIVTDRLDNGTYGLSALHTDIGNITAGMAATDKGVRQVFEKSITANANAGATVVGTVATQACVIESVIIYADTNGALPASTTAATTDGLAGVAGAITFLDASVALTANLDTAGDQVVWTTGGVRLAVGYQIITTLAGGGANPTDLTFVITYYSSAANGGTIS